MSALLLCTRALLSCDHHIALKGGGFPQSPKNGGISVFSLLHLSTVVGVPFATFSQDLSESTTPHKKRASSWATLQVINSYIYAAAATATAASVDFLRASSHVLTPNDTTNLGATCICSYCCRSGDPMMHYHSPIEDERRQPSHSFAFYMLSYIPMCDGIQQHDIKLEIDTLLALGSGR